MRLAFVSLMTRTPWGACEVLWAETAQRALQAGHEVLVSVLRWPELPAQIAALERAGARIELRPRAAWVRRSAVLSRLSRTYKPLEVFAPDAICVSQGGTYDIARSGSPSVLFDRIKRIGAPFVLLCHCQQPAPPAGKLPAIRTIFANASTAGMLADKLRTVSESHLGTAIPNAHIFQNPVNLREIKPLPWPQPEPLRLACVGRLDAVKNHGPLLEALALPVWRERNWTLTVCGSGPLQEQLQRQVREAGLDARVRFAGYVEDIAALWADHHVLVMPSRFEGVPLALVEAMLCSRPVVAVDTGGIAEWVEDGRSGLLIAKPVREEMILALERMWALRGQLESMGRRAHESSLAKRDPDPAGTLLGWLTASAQHPTSAHESSRASRLARAR
jgi:glycosyltransferase involved in cell wall biosynthesis